MMKTVLIFALLLPAAGALEAQNMTGDPVTGIAMSTDPAAAAAVERHAEEIAARQRDMASGASSGAGSQEPHARKTHKRHSGHKGHKGKPDRSAR
jgi:hypothetical protein